VVATADHNVLLAQAQAQHRAGRLAEATALFGELLQLRPEDPQALTPLGMLALQRDDAQQAIGFLERSLAVAPDQPLAHAACGVALRRLGDLNAALESFDRAIALRPSDEVTHSNRGVVLRKSARLDESLASFDRAIELNPDYAEAHNNRGNVLQDLRRLPEALASFDQAIALRPNYANAWWNKARLKILLGDYEEGWRLAEWRWQGPQRGLARNFTQPLWLGDVPVGGKTVLLHAEQGLGDCIQFCRYAPMVAALGANVVLEVPASLTALVATADANITVVAQGSALPAFDLHCPIMSLPRALHTSVTSIPAAVPYLYADPGLQASWQQRLGPRVRPRIGVVWSGSSVQAEDRRRSMPVRMLEPLLQLPCEFHALQKDIRADDAAFLAGCKALRLHQEELTDFAATAALVAEMDLVISVCTSVAHVAGALAQPLWVLVSFMPHYIWLLDRTDSPWYPTATLFRQPRFGDWSSVIEEVAQKLRAERFAPTDRS
jgi:Flp pilus assembly protein TadD